MRSQHVLLEHAHMSGNFYSLWLFLNFYFSFAHRSPIICQTSLVIWMAQEQNSVIIVHIYTTISLLCYIGFQHTFQRRIPRWHHTSSPKFEAISRKEFYWRIHISPAFSCWEPSWCKVAPESTLYNTFNLHLLYFKCYLVNKIKVNKRSYTFNTRPLNSKQYKRCNWTYRE